MVPRGDATAFAAALGRALDDPAWTRATGALARRRVAEACAPESVGRRLRELFFRNTPTLPASAVEQPDATVVSP
jgi:hypothetical protein